MQSLQPLPKEITDQIRFILEGIKAGKLEHNQEVVHCGTAHCVAGWHAVFKAKEKGIEYDPVEERFCGNPGFGDAWDLAEADWCLTESEANILFSRDADLITQFALLRYLESGERVDGAYYSYENGQLETMNRAKGRTTPFISYLQQQKEETHD